MGEITTCPTCGEKIKSGVFSSNVLLDDERCALIAEMKGGPLRKLCSKCGSTDSESAYYALRDQRSAVQKELRSAIQSIPIVTTHTPFAWEYTVIGIASGQSTIGTGLLSEFKSGWTDLFGLQSNAYNKKIVAGEHFCSEQLRAKALEMGGNAIIAVDIDYSEMGAEKGMIMVCMAGTVVRLRNLDVLDETHRSNLEKVGGLSKMIIDWKVKYPQAVQSLTIDNSDPWAG